MGRRTLSLPGAIAVIRYSTLDGDLNFELGALATFTRGDLIALPSIAWRIDDHHQLKLGGALFEGRSDGYGGLYTSNDQVYLAYAWSR